MCLNYQVYVIIIRHYFYFGKHNLDKKKKGYNNIKQSLHNLFIACLRTSEENKQLIN